MHLGSEEMFRALERAVIYVEDDGGEFVFKLAIAKCKIVEQGCLKSKRKGINDCVPLLQRKLQKLALTS